MTKKVSEHWLEQRFLWDRGHNDNEELMGKVEQ